MSETALSKPLPDGEHGDAVEARRLEALDRFDVLDTPKEEAFERIARLVRNVMGLPIGMVSLIDGHRHGSRRRPAFRRASSSAAIRCAT